MSDSDHLTHPPLEPGPPVVDYGLVPRTATRIVGVICVMLLIFGMTLLVAGPSAFFDWPSLIMVVGGTLALLLVTFGHDGCLTALRLTIRRSKAEHVETLRRGDPVAFFRCAAVYALILGAIATLIGVIGMLSNMDDPSKIGARMAFALLSEIYAAIIAMFCFAISVIQAQRYPKQTQARKATRFAVPIASASAAAVFFVVLGTFAALMATFSPFRLVN